MSEKGSYPSRRFSDQELTLSSWYNAKRELLLEIGYGAFIVLNVALFAAFGFELYEYFKTYQDTENAFTQSSVLEIDWPRIRLVIAPDPIQRDTVDVLTAGSFLDFIARITNPNTDRVGEFEYRFVWAGGETVWLPSFVLPGESKYLLALGQEGSQEGGGAPTPELEISSVRWQSLSKADRERLDLTRDGLVILSSIFIRNVNENLTGAPISGAEIVIENRLPFPMQNIPLNILVTDVGGIEALNRITVDRIGRKESRTLRVRWFTFVGGGTVSVEPDINYLDDTHIAPRAEEEEVFDDTN